ncbi:MAG: hypothetical protein WBA37_11835 [Xanthobacteraceae bacterium]
MAEAIGALIISSLPTAVATALPTTILGVSTAAVIGNVAIVGSLAAASYLTRPDAPKPSDGQVTTKQPISPRRRNYGRVKVGGVIIFSEVAGGKLYEVVAINQGEIDAYEEHWLGDIQVTLDGDSNAIPVEAGSTAFSNKGRHYVQVYYEYGTDSDPGFAGLRATFPTKWTEAHRAYGVAKVLIVSQQPDSRDYTQVFPAGRPVYRGVIRASKVWDPRDSNQDKDNPATWTWSDNPVLHALDYHRHADAMRLATFDDVLFTATALAEDWIPAANVCDEAVTLKVSGTEPRYTCAGGYLLTQPPKDVLPQILATCVGQVFMRPDGAIGIRVGQPVTPSLVFDADEKHILGYTGFRSGDDVFLAANEITAKYTSPDHDFQDTEATPWRNEADITARGQVLTSEIDLSWVPSYPQARRLMKAEYHRKNPACVGQFATDLHALNGFGEQYLTLTLAEMGVSAQDFEVNSFEINPGEGTCALNLSAFDSAAAFAWDAATEEGDPPPIPDQTRGSNAIEVPDGVTGTPAVRTISIGTNGVVLVIDWDAPDRIDFRANAQYKLHSASDWLPATVSDDGTSAETPLLQDGQTYDVRVQFMTGSRTGDWTEVDSIVVGVPPDPPIDFTGAPDGIGGQLLTWRNASSPNLAVVRVWAGDASSTFPAVHMGSRPATPGATDSWSFALASGTWKFWMVSETAAGVRSAPVGPQIVTT